MGNPCRGDDAAGSRVAQRVRERPGVRVIDAQDVPENFLGQVVQRRPDTVLFVDAVDLGSEPGSMALLDAKKMAAYSPATHRVPVSLLASCLEQETRARIFMLAIQPQHSAFLEPMSEGVTAAADALARMLNEVLELRPLSSLREASLRCSHAHFEEAPA